MADFAGKLAHCYYTITILFIYCYRFNVINGRKMELSAIKTLKLIMGGSLTVQELASRLGLSYPRTAAIVRELLREGYCEKSGGRVILASSAKAGLVKKLSYRYELSTLFGGSNERLLLALPEPLDIREIQHKSELAQSTIYQALRKLMAIGAVCKVDDRYVVAEDPNLKAFLELLKREREATEVEPYAVLIHSGHGLRLKKVQAGQEARGSKTAFSLFPKHGVDYLSPQDYYVEPAEEISIEKALIHALIAAETKAEGTMCAVFYLKNINKIDPVKIKNIAKKFGISSLLADLQNYVKLLPVRDVERFLPWDEFVEKANLYEIKVSLPPEAEKVEATLRELGRRLDSTVHAYLFGGANLLLRGLKKATKDLDLVVETKEDFSKLRDALLSLNFRSLKGNEMTPSDKKLNPSGIYVAENLPRFDLFTKTICNAFSLIGEIKERVKAMVFGKLVLHLLSLEDVLLLKSITDREGDLEDMGTIVRLGGDLNWNEVLKTYFKEEEKAKRHFCLAMLDNIELLQQREGVTIPIHAALLRHCIDIGILQSLSYGATSVKGIREMMDFPEYTIRNRMRKLVKDGKVSKRLKRDRPVLAITEKGKSELFQ